MFFFSFHQLLLNKNIIFLLFLVAYFSLSNYSHYNTGQSANIFSAGFPVEPTSQELKNTIDKIFATRKTLRNKQDIAKNSRSMLQTVRVIGYSPNQKKMLAVLSHYNQLGVANRNDLMLYDSETKVTSISVSRNRPHYLNALKKIEDSHNIITSATPLKELVSTKTHSSELIGLDFHFNYTISSNKSMALLRLDVGTSRQRHIALLRRVEGPFIENYKIFLHRIYTSTADAYTNRTGLTPALFVFRLHRDDGKQENVQEIGLFINPESVITNNNLRVFRKNDYLLSDEQKTKLFATERIVDPPFPPQLITYTLNGKQTSTAARQ